MNSGRILLVTAVAALIGSFFLLGLNEYMTLEYIKSQQSVIANMVDSSPIKSATLFVTIYIAVTASSLPGAAILTLVGGAIFGLVWGTLLVSAASTTGATIAVLASRYLFSDSVETKYDKYIEKVKHGVEREGAFYLFTQPEFLLNWLNKYHCWRRGQSGCFDKMELPLANSTVD